MILKRKKEINNDDYGGFMVSKRVAGGEPVAFTYRDESSIRVFNGWKLYSETDAKENAWYDPRNMVVLNATSVAKLAPEMLDIFHAPYGTELRWEYENGALTGFYDLVEEKEIPLPKKKYRK